MMKYLRMFVVTILLAGVVFAASPATAVLAAASSNDEICQTINGISPDGGTCNNPSGSSVNQLITIAINMLSVVAGVVAVIMLIVSGFKYVTSRGDANQISSAKQSLIYAIVGMVVVALSQIIVKFVLSETT